MKCFECEADADHMHHVIPRSMGGTKTIPLCARCHWLAHGRSDFERADSHRALTRAGLARVRAERGYTGGPKRYGMEDADAPVIHAVLALRAEGMTIRAIATEVARRGFTTRKGTPMSVTQVQRIVTAAKRAHAT